MKKHHNRKVVQRTPTKKGSEQHAHLFKMSKFKKVPAKISSTRDKNDPAITGLTTKLDAIVMTDALTSNKSNIAKAAEPKVRFEL
jgi:hypothetical protein